MSSSSILGVFVKYWGWKISQQSPQGFFHTTEKNPTIKVWKCLSHKNPQVKQKTWEKSCVKVLCENHLKQNKPQLTLWSCEVIFWNSRPPELTACNLQDVYELSLHFLYSYAKQWNLRSIEVIYVSLCLLIFALIWLLIQCSHASW